MQRTERILIILVRATTWLILPGTLILWAYTR